MFSMVYSRDIYRVKWPTIYFTSLLRVFRLLHFRVQSVGAMRKKTSTTVVLRRSPNEMEYIVVIYHIYDKRLDKEEETE